MRDQRSFTINKLGEIVPYLLYKSPTMEECELDWKYNRNSTKQRISDESNDDSDYEFELAADPDYVPDHLFVDDKGIAHDLYHMKQPDVKSGRMLSYSPLFTDSMYLYVIAMRF